MIEPDELPDRHCRVCGEARDPDDPAALAWVLERDARGQAGVICPGCARRHARDIEAGLPTEYW